MHDFGGMERQYMYSGWCKKTKPPCNILESQYIMSTFENQGKCIIEYYFEG